jgi:hypothetical protein
MVYASDSGIGIMPTSGLYRHIDYFIAICNPRKSDIELFVLPGFLAL